MLTSQYFLPTLLALRSISMRVSALEQMPSALNDDTYVFFICAHLAAQNLSSKEFLAIIKEYV